MHISAVILIVTMLAGCLCAFASPTRRLTGRNPRRRTHPFNVHDLWAMQRISEPQVSPDGQKIVFVVRQTDFQANCGRDDLWLINLDGSGLRQLTTHPSGSRQPRWSPDGKWIYFLSARDSSTQIFRISADGGEAHQVTRLPVDVRCFAIAPDGRHLAVSLEVFPQARSLAETAKRLEQISKRQATGRIYDRLFVRHWDAWKDGRRAHLFSLRLGAALPVENAADLTAGMDADVPSKPFGGPEEFTFTPDSKGLVFAARNVGRQEAWSTQFDLYYVPRDGSAAPRLLTPGNRATITQPVFSPDGQYLAYRAMVRPGYESDRFRIVVRRWPAGKPRVLTEDWDRSAATIVWSPDGRTIYTTADNLGQHSLFAVDVQTGQVRELLHQGRVSDVAAIADRLVFGLRHLCSPVELHTLEIAGSARRSRPDQSVPRQLTRINARRLATIRFGEPEQFTFRGWNGEQVYAYIVKPADFDPRKKYPVALLIHGGPQSSFGNDFHYRWNPQIYAGAGYAALMIDFHGSTGYGQRFTDSINGHWGDRPLEDLKKGLAAALRRYPWTDGRRVAGLGASYGAYLVNWIHGVWPGRFRCLVCHDGNLDERMAYYETEELWFPEWERGGTPWEKPGAYTRHNPIEHVHRWQTPTLVIHGGRDFRVVDTQGLATFTALQRRGIPSQLLYFPDENHWVLKPANSIQWHETVLSWLDRWCRK